MPLLWYWYFETKCLQTLLVLANRWYFYIFFLWLFLNSHALFMSIEYNMSRQLTVWNNSYIYISTIAKNIRGFHSFKFVCLQSNYICQKHVGEPRNNSILHDTRGCVTYPVMPPVMETSLFAGAYLYRVYTLQRLYVFFLYRAFHTTLRRPFAESLSACCNKPQIRILFTQF